MSSQKSSRKSKKKNEFYLPVGEKLKLMREESILLNPIKTSKSSSSVLYTKYGVNPPSVLKTDYNPEYDENIRPIHNYSTINHALTPSTLPVMYSKPISPQVRKTSPVKGLSYISSGSTVPMYSYDLQLPLPPNIQSNVGSEYFFDPKLSEPQPSKYPLPLPDHGYKQRVNYEMVKKYKKSEDEKKNVPKAEEKILEDLCSFNSVALNMPADMQPYKRMEVVTPMPQDKIVEHISISQSKVSPPPNARSYESLLDSFSLHHILLKHGKTITNTPEFESFARAFKFRWSEITAVIICFEEWAAENNIELVLISGRKVAERSLDRDFMGRIGKGGEDIWNKKRIIPTSGGYNSEYQKSNLQNLISNKAFVKKFILPCIVNLDDITAELKKPGHTYNGCIHGKGNAVVLIQSVVRMFLAVQKYKRISRKGVAATIIQRWYRVCRARAKLEKELDISTRFRDKVCSYMQEVLKKDLKKMRGERRLIIHIPSIGWDERIRKSMNTLSETKLSNEIQNDDQKDDESKNKGKEKDNDRKCILFSSLENQELSRLCDLEDPLVDIIMISPHPFPSDVSAYIHKLLVAGGVKNIESRLRIIVPEMCDTIITRIKKDSFLLTNKPFPSSIKVDSENITNPYYQNSISQQYDVESKNIYYTFNFPSHFSVAFLLLISPKAMRKLMSYCIALGTDYSKFEIKEGGNSGEEFENLSNFPVNTRCSIKCSSVSRYEQIISEILRVPFTSSFYIQSSAFGTKSGAKRIFAAADVNTFPSVYDIYDPMLLPAAIARLASRNVPLSSSSRGSATRSTTSETFSQRVIIKIDDEVRGRGHAVIEIGNFVKNALNSLSLSFQDVVLSPAAVALAALEEREEEEDLRESKEFGFDENNLVKLSTEKGNTVFSTHRDFVNKIKENQKKLEDELIPKLIQVLGLLPSASGDVPMHPWCVKLIGGGTSPSSYPTWPFFLQVLTTTGAIVEVAPNANRIVGNPVVDVLVELNGDCKVAFMGNKLFSSEFVACGAIVPQTAVPTIALNDASLAIGKVCFEKKIYGQIYINYVVYVDDWDSLRMCAVDLNVQPSPYSFAFRWISFLTKGFIDFDSGLYILPSKQADKYHSQFTMVNEKNSKINPISTEKEKLLQNSRSVVLLDNMYQTELSLIPHATFFSLCRENAVTFDFEEKRGSLFFLPGPLINGIIAMAFLDHTILSSLEFAQTTLQIICAKTLSCPFMFQRIEKKKREKLDALSKVDVAPALSDVVLKVSQTQLQKSKMIFATPSRVLRTAKAVATPVSLTTKVPFGQIESRIDALNNYIQQLADTSSLTSTTKLSFEKSVDVDEDVKIK